MRTNLLFQSCSSSSLHLFGPSTSLASHSQSSLEIILENSAGEILSPYAGSVRRQRSARLNRNDYEDISNDNGDDDDEDDDSKSRMTKGAQKWRNVRAVMAYYCSLRKIKRNGALNIYNSKQNRE